MPEVICFASPKGGSGKTTVTATLGTFLAEIGFRVLLIDCDEATNGLTLLYINEVNSFPQIVGANKKSLVGMFDGHAELKRLPDRIYVSDNLVLMPASFTFSMKHQFSFAEFLERCQAIVIDLEDKFDFILLDAQAGADPVSLAALHNSVCDHVIIVSEYDPLSAAGVERLKGIAPDDLAFDRTWILLNKMLPEFVDSFSEFLSVSHYLPPLPWTADVVRAYAKRELALDFSSGNEFTLAVLQTARALPIHGLGAKIDDWMEGKASSLREPVETQYRDLEDMLKATKEQYSDIKQSLTRRQLIWELVENSLLASLAALVIWLVINILGPEQPLFDKQNALGLSRVQFLLAMIMAIFAAFLAQRIFRITRPKNISADLELERLQRQMAVYSERLREFDFLRAADAGTVITRSFSRAERKAKARRRPPI